ncbi:MAG: acyltransferase [bacterium]|jgi:acetyltransferase-like isoleucine patch superfamily enzyme
MLLGKLFYYANKLINRYKRNYEKSLFRSCGQNVYFGEGCRFTHSTVEIGDHVYIGSGAVFQSAYGTIKIGNHVMFGPCVHIHGGNHIYNKIGDYMDEVHDKQFGDDGTVEIQNDVGVGANSTLLKGICVGEGSIIAAGSVVTDDIAPYSIVGGNPAKLLKMRFSEDNIILHKQKLNERNSN